MSYTFVSVFIDLC